MLNQLVYVSNRKPNCTEAEIDNILASCKKNNPSLNITGVLLYSDKKFIQLVEGESKVVMGLYDKIKGDDRHSNVMMISLSPIMEKTFPSWQMGSKKIAIDKVAFDTDISAKDQKVFNKILSGQEEDGERVLNILKKFF